MESTTQQEIDEEIKHIWNRFEREKDDRVRRLSTRLSNVGAAIVEGSSNNSNEEDKAKEMKPLLKDTKSKEEEEEKVVMKPLLNDTKSKEEDELDSLMTLNLDTGGNCKGRYVESTSR